MLRELQKEPSDLIGPDAGRLLESCPEPLGRKRLEPLLGRGFLLSQVLDRWTARAIWVVSRADASYPSRLKARLKENAPPILYGCGDAGLLETGGLAVVGSREVDEPMLEYTKAIGRLSASARQTIVSGGAKGVDRAAMSGALEAAGKTVGVLSDGLEKASISRENRAALMNGQLVFISSIDPAAGFNVGIAMQRNKLIYALADAALVIQSDLEKGGTWTGAIEQIERLRLVPIYVRNGADCGPGNTALLQRGGRPWPNPPAALDLLKLLKEKVTPPTAPVAAVVAQDSAAEELMSAVRGILKPRLAHPHSEAEVAELLDVAKAQAKLWLMQLVAEGLLTKLKKPIRYRTVGSGQLVL